MFTTANDATCCTPDPGLGSKGAAARKHAGRKALTDYSLVSPASPTLRDDFAQALRLAAW